MLCRFVMPPLLGVCVCVCFLSSSLFLNPLWFGKRIEVLMEMLGSLPCRRLSMEYFILHLCFNIDGARFLDDRVTFCMKL